MASHDYPSAAESLLEPGATVHGFTVERVEDVPEADARAYVMRHTSGARTLYLACDDENKAFAIGFKTPPADDTGVFHILEHSVLCGSRRYPVKEPFVDLIKSSMQTFLNALTYPDKTVYPVASTNEQDLLNLMDVYMDAVLEPAIYDKPTIFQQEGWHYEIETDEDGNPLEDAPLTLNGVVFNEMKGALSDPMDVLDNAVNRALFPSTAYAHESGGNPNAIPSLTYEQFLDNHARHYALSNSYIVLYGDLDADRVLAHLDESHLSCAPARQAAGAPNPLERQAPVVVGHARQEMQTTPENAAAGLAYVIGDVLDTERVIAADVLFETILGSNEAPLKRAILDSGLGGDVVSYTSGSCLQPYELIVLKNAQDNAAEKFRDLVEATCRDLVENGIPRERLEATISSNEYELRQRDYGTADGVVLALGALSTWIYAEDEGTGSATLGLRYENIFKKLRAQLEGGYFERLLSEIVLESDHKALVELVPTEEAADDEAARLAAVRERMTADELVAVAESVRALRLAQETPDSPEQKATLPRLSREDIGAARPEPMLTVDTTAPVPTLKHDIPTRQLAYALTYFDISHLSFAELPYVSLLCRLMLRLRTDARPAYELDSYVKSNLGFLSFSTEVYAPDNPRCAAPKLVVAAGALSEKVEALATIPAEVWATTRFDETDKIRDVCQQMRIGMEQGFVSAGHSAALRRAFSYVSPAAVVREQLSGVEFYRFLRDLLDNFDERADGLVGKLAELQGRIFTSTGTFASFIGSDEDYRGYWDAAGALGLEPRTAPAKELYVPAPEDKHEAFVIPADVCYCAQAHDPRLMGIETGGAWGVASGALSYDFLWNEVRVKGGAYGCGFRVAADRQLAFYSYRDPAVDPTLKRFAEAGSWLSSFSPDKDAFDGFIIAGTAGHDAPLKPFALARRQDSAYFSKRAAGYRERMRAEMLAATPEDVAALGADVSRVAAEAPACVFGGRDILEKSSAGFNVVDLLA